MSEQALGAALVEPVSGGQAVESDALETKTILLLDGVRLFLKLEETLLSRREWKVLTATTAAEGRALLDAHAVDLVLMDYVLPDATGDDMVRYIRASRNKDAGILIVTARGLREHVERCMAAGCNSFLFKPVSRAVLTSRVKELLKVPVRRHVRTLVRLNVDGASGERFLFGNSVNLSVGGMLLESSIELALGDHVSLRFFLPADGDPVVTRTRVVRCTPGASAGATCYGLVFEDLSDIDRERIARFVALSSPDEGELAP